MNIRIAWPIYVLFLIPAVAFANWIPRIPAVKANIGLSDTVLGLSLSGAAIGAIIVLPISSFVINLVGLNRSIFLLLILFLPFFALIGIAGSAIVLFIVLFFIGFCMSAFEVALNTKATEFENLNNCRIMTTCHGFWSLGTIFGSFSGSMFAGWEISTGSHFLLIAVVLILPSIIAGMGCPAEGPRKSGAESMVTLPSLALIGLCVITFTALAVEGAIMDWSAIYLSESLGESPFYSGLAFTVFALTATIGRFSGDYLRGMFSPRILMITSGIVTVVGLIVALFNSNLIVVLLGFAIAGLGLSLPYALAIVAAAGRGDRPAAANVAALSMLGFLAFLICPPLIGISADLVGLRNSLAALIPLTLLFILLSTEFRSR